MTGTVSWPAGAPVAPPSAHSPPGARLRESARSRGVVPRCPATALRPARGSGPRRSTLILGQYPALRARFVRGGTMSILSKPPAVRRWVASSPVPPDPRIPTQRPIRAVPRRARELSTPAARVPGDHGPTGADARRLRRLPARDPIVPDPRPAGDGDPAGPLPGALPLEEAALRGRLDPGDDPRQRPGHVDRSPGRLGGAPRHGRGAAPLADSRRADRRADRVAGRAPLRGPAPSPRRPRPGSSRWSRRCSCSG